MGAFMLQVKSISDAVLISVHTGQSPNIVLFPYNTGAGAKLLFQFPTLSDKYQYPISKSDLALAHTILNRFDEINRLQVAAQNAYREATR